jgi:hypothetical protein
MAVSFSGGNAVDRPPVHGSMPRCRARNLSGVRPVLLLKKRAKQDGSSKARARATSSALKEVKVR